MCGRQDTTGPLVGAVAASRCSAPSLRGIPQKTTTAVGMVVKHLLNSMYRLLHQLCRWKPLTVSGSSPCCGMAVLPPVLPPATVRNA
jgi:hypothetical protein